MSFGLPTLKNKPAIAENFDFNDSGLGVPNLLVDGFTSAKSTVNAKHPLYQSEQNYKKNQEQLKMVMLRNIQGLHAPLRIGMEMKAASKVGHLPFLPSSNAMLDTLSGSDIDVGPEDVFNTAEFREIAGQPHAMVERSLGIL